MDPEARAYFLAIEDHYQRTVGRPLILSPKDLEAVTRWWSDGIPVGAARDGITRYFERIRDDPRKRRRRLAVRYAENDVRDAAEDLRVSRIGDRRGEGLEEQERVSEVVRGLAERLAELGSSGPVGQRASELANRVRQVREAWDAGTAEAEDVEEQLEAWDAELLEAVRGSLSQEERAELRRDAEGRLSDMRSRMDEAAWEKTVGLLEEKLLREQAGLPRLSLYGY